MVKAVSALPSAGAAVAPAVSGALSFRLNDVHGHEAGDAALRHVAAVLEEAVGPGALVARQGGEEFVVVVAAGLRDAGALAERVRLAVPARPGGHPPLSISIGVAASPPCEPTLPALLRSADGALYRAKAAGRDRVEVAACGASGARPGPLTPDRGGAARRPLPRTSRRAPARGRVRRGSPLAGP